MKPIALSMLGSALLLAGCATRMQSTEAQKPISVPASAAKKVVLSLDGSSTATGASSWSALKSAWQDECRTEANLSGMALSFQDGPGYATGEDGTLLSVYVNDFRYVSSGARFGLGIMTGNAFIDAKVKFTNLKNGAAFGERPYNTSSIAWQGIFSAMTAKQAQAICKDLLDTVSGVAAPAKK